MAERRLCPPYDLRPLIVAIVVAVAVTQAGGQAPAQAAKLSPPVIHEPFTPLPFSLLKAPRFQRKFIAGHSAWLAYRRADCVGMSAIYEGGTFQSLDDADCIATRNDERIKDLREFRHQLANG